MSAKKKGEGLTHRYNLLVDPAWLEKVEQHAKRLGVSPAAFIRMAAIRAMESDPIPLPPDPKPKRPRPSA